jgi:hypothetical protein
MSDSFDFSKTTELMVEIPDNSLTLGALLHIANKLLDEANDNNTLVSITIRQANDGFGHVVTFNCNVLVETQLVDNHVGLWPDDKH